MNWEVFSTAITYTHNNVIVGTAILEAVQKG